MKKIILISTFIFLAVSVQAQINPELIDISNSKITNHWSLAGYLWSQNPSYSQDKSVLDFQAIENWRFLGRGDAALSISCDGKYFAHIISYNSYRKWNVDSLVIQSIDGVWRKSFSKGSPGFFSNDGKYYFFQDRDTLNFLKVGTDDLKKIAQVESYQRPPSNNLRFIAYQLKDRAVLLQNLTNGKEYFYKDVSNYDFKGNDGRLLCISQKGKLTVFNLIEEKAEIFSDVKGYQIDVVGESLLLQRDIPKGTELQYITSANSKTKVIWSNVDTSQKLISYNFDQTGTQVVYTLEENTSQLSIWYWRVGMENPVERVNNYSEGIEEDMIIKRAAVFEGNGDYIKFGLEKKAIAYPADANSAEVDVWNYKDSKLQSIQLLDLTSHRVGKYFAFCKATGGPIIAESDQQRIRGFGGGCDFVVLTKNSRSLNGDRFWEKGYYLDSSWLVSLKDGSRTLLANGANNLPFWYSPLGDYLVYFDKAHGGNYLSYNLKSGVVANLSKGIASGLLTNIWDNGWPAEQSRNQPYGVAYWQDDLGYVFVYDKYDIWRLDLRGNQPAKNLTNGYGRANHIVFRFSDAAINTDLASQKRTILLKVYNEDSKYSGFYSLNFSNTNSLKFLYMGPCVMEKVPGILADDMIPLKASQANVWVVKKQSAVEAPNYFVTDDFKTYKQITNLQPQKKYNWLTVELRNFKQLNGRVGQGRLYKPENFDSLKKYPLIISFYFKLSDLTYFFPVPELMISPGTPWQNPAWLVSHGYLVFVPDIDFSNGYWGPSSLNALDGATRYLSKLPFVNSSHIALIGHSNSGRFAYYALTHSKSFAAMSIGAGTTDIIGTSLSLVKSTQASYLEWAEVESLGKGLNALWDNKTTWLDHSAVFNADNVASPLLIFHNKNDGAPYEQAIELFTALRRLEKKAWWLQYDKGGHGVEDLSDKRDFTIRFTQFFDHYLKNAPAPRWMTQGIPAKLKGLESRYELDPSGTCDLPDKRNCPICKAWNQQYKRTPEMFTKPISAWHLDKDIEVKLEKEQELIHKKNMEKDRVMQKEVVRRLKEK